MEPILARTDSDPKCEARSNPPHTRLGASACDHLQPEAGHVAPNDSETRYRALYDDLPLMVFRLDPEGRVLSVNEHGARELGYACDELAGGPVSQVFHPEDRQAAERQLGWALEAPGEVSRWELRKVRKNGSVLWVRETVRVLQAPGGGTEILVVCEDVTERRRAVERIAEYRDQLRELNAELSRAEDVSERRLARVLHDEVGQALAAARMRVCELRDSEGSRERTTRLEELRELVDQTIEVTRSLTFQLSPPILRDLGLAAALQALGERTAEDRVFRFGFVLGEGWIPPSRADGIVLYRAIRELFHNVTKHARASCVGLELDGGRDGIRIVLEDDGVGFDATSTGAGYARGAGDGLGLFQVGERMARLGGRFDIDSVSGRGTRAVLRLGARPGGSLSP